MIALLNASSDRGGRKTKLPRGTSLTAGAPPEAEGSHIGVSVRYALYKSISR